VARPSGQPHDDVVDLDPPTIDDLERCAGERAPAPEVLHDGSPSDVVTRDCAAARDVPRDVVGEEALERLDRAARIHPPL